MDILAQGGAQLPALKTKKSTLLLKSWHQRSAPWIHWQMAAHLRLKEFAQLSVFTREFFFFIGSSVHLPLRRNLYSFVFVFVSSLVFVFERICPTLWLYPGPPTSPFAQVPSSHTGKAAS